MKNHHGVYRVSAISEHQFGGVCRISQWQRDVVHPLLVVDDDGVRAECRYRQRVERIVLYIIG